VDHSARVSARSKREIVTLEEGDPHAPKRAIARDPGPVDAATDDDDVYVYVEPLPVGIAIDGIVRGRQGAFRRYFNLARSAGVRY
jgi:hypothetical protein